MTDSKTTKWESFKHVLPYILAATITITAVAVGSLDKNTSDGMLTLDYLAKNNYNISTDQLSEMYVVANLSNAAGLASASDVASNYVLASSLYTAGQTSMDKLEKPSITNIDVSRGVVEYVVKDGDSIDSIAAAHSLTPEQVRWSNNLKNNATVAPGNILYLPSVPGIVYTVKANDTVETIAARYGSTAAEIVALNDLEVSGVAEGARIVIKDGVLPANERPDYVAPRQSTTYRNTNIYTYTYLGDTSNRVGITCNRSLGGGQCVSWAVLKRPDLGIRGNANRWDDEARAKGILVNRTPSAGAIFQTDSGWVGHVGYVESVNPDGSINVSERNYRGCGGVMFSTIPASEVGKFNYIH